MCLPLNIGVALSGCDIGGIGAYGALNWLADAGLHIRSLAACGTPAAGTLLFATGPGQPQGEALLEELLCDYRRQGLASALDNLETRLPPAALSGISGLTLAAARISDGCAAAFTNDFRCQADTLHSFPLESAGKALGAAMNRAELPAGPGEENRQLCDYSACYGCPFFPLYMAGCNKILSLSFLPSAPNTAYEIAVMRNIGSSSKRADLHISIPCPPGEQEGASCSFYQRNAASKLESCRKQILEALLFASA